MAFYNGNWPTTSETLTALTTADSPDAYAQSLIKLGQLAAAEGFTKAWQYYNKWKYAHHRLEHYLRVGVLDALVQNDSWQEYFLNLCLNSVIYNNMLQDS